MRLIFAGTPEFAARALDALVRAGHEIALVLTQPDRPAGRGLKLRSSAVKQLALQYGLAVGQPVSLKSAEVESQIAELGADAMIVAAYGLIVPPTLLVLPRLGCINIHASLLPRWRGAAPVQRAILAGDSVTGICLMQMDAGLDSGPILSRHEIPIECHDSAGSLTQKLAALGAEAIVAALPRLERGELSPEAQEAAAATYASKVKKDEAQIDWSCDALSIERSIRAYDPFPGASTQLDGQSLKIWRATVVGGAGEPGCVLSTGGAAIHVACGRGALALLELQQAGGQRVPAEAFVRGSGLAPGRCLGGMFTCKQQQS